MGSIITAFPFITGGILIIVGLILLIRRKSAIHTEGTIVDVARKIKRRARVQTDLESPVVKYRVGNNEYTMPSNKFFTQGIMNFKKGKSIKIRVSRRDNRRFVPEESGGMALLFLIFGGIFIILADAVILLRFG